MNVRFSLMIVWLVVMTLALPALAEDGEQAKPAEKSAEKTAGADAAKRPAPPTGWTSVKPGKGVLAAFHHTEDAKAQIEVRVSPHVKEKQGQFFFTSFHSNLQKAGFGRLEVRKDATYADKKGEETEYETNARKNKFRLIVWQYLHNDSAYMVVGFFPAGKRDTYYDDFKTVIETLKFE